MNHSVLQVLGSELFGGSSNIALLIPIAPEITIQRSYQNIASNVELPFIVKKRH